MLAKPALSGLMLTSLSILLLLTAILTTPPAARPLSSASGISAWEDLVVGTNTFGNAIATEQ